MTLREAFEQWGEAPRNVTLATRSKRAVDAVLLKTCGDIELKDMNNPLKVSNLMGRCSCSHQEKVKAASILVYLLDWGAQHGYCRKPRFTYEIANGLHIELPKKEEPKVVASATDEADIEKDLSASEPEPQPEPKPEPTPEPEKPKTIKAERRRGKEVLQIDKETLEELARYDSCMIAGDALKANGGSISKCARNHTAYRGYYWVFADKKKEALTFFRKKKERLALGPAGWKKGARKASAPSGQAVRAVRTERPSHPEQKADSGKALDMLSLIREHIALCKSFSAGSCKSECMVDGYKVIIEVRRPAA